jgi:RNA polymerase sigma factor (sigma-70 family)
MPASSLNRVLHHLRRATLLHEGTALTDGELLGRFLGARDAAAFEGLMQRHGPMVLGVCRRVLGSCHDAEDAFQATFLVLVRRAASIVPRDQVGNWLHGVAYRTALEAKTARARRSAKEGQVRPVARGQAVVDVVALHELRQRLDQELERLPDNYRAAVVLCDLEGKTHKEAARLLGWPVGTLSTRLLRAHRLLARRLSHPGPALTAGTIAAVFAPTAASASLPSPLVADTIHSAMAFALGGAAVSTNASTLAQGVLKTMFLSRLKMVTAVLVTIGVLGFAVGVLIRPVFAQKSLPARQAAVVKTAPQEKQPDKVQAALFEQLQSVRWHVIAVDLEKRTIQVADAPLLNSLSSIAVGEDAWFHVVQGKLTLEAVAVAKDATITVNGKKAQLKDVRAKMRVTVKFAEGKPIVTAIDAIKYLEDGPILKAVDAKEGTITVAIGKDGELKKLPVAKDAYIYLFHQGNVGKLADLEPGMGVALKLAIEKDRIVVKDIRAHK